MAPCETRTSDRGTGRALHPTDLKSQVNRISSVNEGGSPRRPGWFSWKNRQTVARPFDACIIGVAWHVIRRLSAAPSFAIFLGASMNCFAAVSASIPNTSNVFVPSNSHFSGFRVNQIFPNRYTSDFPVIAPLPERWAPRGEPASPPRKTFLCIRR